MLFRRINKRKMPTVMPIVMVIESVYWSGSICFHVRKDSAVIGINTHPLVLAILEFCGRL